MRTVGFAAVVAVVSIGVLAMAPGPLRGEDRSAFEPNRAGEDDLEPRPVIGYRNGRARKIEVVTVGWAEVEVRTAKQFLRMREAAAGDGVALSIRSGYRSRERQAWLYEAWRAGYGNRAARPGYSKHEDGKALDIELYDPAVRPWLEKHARRFGFKRTVAREPWHWELVRVPRSRARKPARPRP